MQGQDRHTVTPRHDSARETGGTKAVSTEAGGTSRRRLLKGAALGAPAILTLRSGAVMAASSCTGYLVGRTDVDPEAGEHCVVPRDSNECPADKIRDGYAVEPIAETTSHFDAESGEWIEQETGVYVCPSNAVVMSSTAFMSLNLPATRG